MYGAGAGCCSGGDGSSGKGGLVVVVVELVVMEVPVTVLMAGVIAV